MKQLLLLFVVILSVSVQSADDYGIKFGILGNDDGKFSLLVETSVIPLIPIDQGLYYGVEITPENDDPYVIELVAELPGEPQQLTGAFKNTDPQQVGKGLEFPPYVLSGISTIPMGFDEGDPLGSYTLKVYANKKLIKTIEYQAIENPN